MTSGHHFEITVRIADGVVEGRFPRWALNLVLEWYGLHQAELLENWNLAQERKPLPTSRCSAPAFGRPRIGKALAPHPAGPPSKEGRSRGRRWRRSGGEGSRPRHAGADGLLHVTTLARRDHARVPPGARLRAGALRSARRAAGEVSERTNRSDSGWATSGGMSSGVGRPSPRSRLSEPRRVGRTPPTSYRLAHAFPGRRSSALAHPFA
ncbi:MAG: hypothetical protein KatS3mg076_2544 [Candidatus Binatia bacterium]|nr:MAG: hypothetical protein KatS3mg076_2544 [Candidatus Binatia bacterium]